jgi:N-acetylmuramic acid 6-phosphate (MurNAc-6-P) etherase
MEALGCDEAAAGRLIRRSGGSLKVAIVMGRMGCSRAEAARRLARAEGHVARALSEK